MREIKFRCYWKSLKVMSYFDNIAFTEKNDGCINWVNKHNPNNFDGFSQFDSNNILMQFTGLIDKNEVDVYEGDLCKSSGYYAGDYRYEEFIGEVIFEDGCYLLDGGGLDIGCELDHATIFNQNIEVIGNIYQNKDLLK